MNSIALVVGTRGSELALAQTQLIIDLLHKKNSDKSKKLEITKKIIKTSGDEKTSGPHSLQGLTGKDSFTRELDEALVRQEIDLAVHSLKDVPVDSDSIYNDKIQLAAFPPRDSPFDVLITKKGGQTLNGLRKSAIIGTSSARRTVQLKKFRPDLDVREIHGNVPTRIRKLRDDKPDLDGIILAEAGLKRLGLQREIDEVISKDVILPAAGQGCIAVSVRSGDELTRSLVKQIDDETTRNCVGAERAFSSELGAGCNLPIAALATMSQGTTILEGLIALDSFGARSSAGDYGVVRAEITGPSEKGDELGRRLARDLKKQIATEEGGK